MKILKIIKDVLVEVGYFLLMWAVFIPALLFFFSIKNICRAISFLGRVIEGFGDTLSDIFLKLGTAVVRWGDKLFLK